MIKERIGDCSYVGVYNGKTYYVLFNGGIVMPKTGDITHPNKAWTLLNELYLNDPRVLETLNEEVALVEDECGNILMVVCNPEIYELPEYMPSDVLMGSLREFCYWLIDHSKDAEQTLKALEIVREELLEKDKYGLGEELYIDLGIAGKKLAKEIVDAIPPAIRSTLSEDTVLAALQYAHKYIMG